jgi:beta-carotene 15,15'-monooxygenase
VDPNSLTTDEKCDGNKMFGLNGQSAHPLTEPSGDMYNIGFNLFPTAKYCVIRLPKSSSSREMFKKAKIIATIPSRWTGAMAINHSFGMTERYIVFVEQPYVVSVSRIAQSVLKGDTLKDVLEWRSQEQNRFHVVEKATGKIFKTEFVSSEAFYFMHFVNCYEQNDQVRSFKLI